MQLDRVRTFSDFITELEYLQPTFMSVTSGVTHRRCRPVPSVPMCSAYMGPERIGRGRGYGPLPLPAESTNEFLCSLPRYMKSITCSSRPVEKSLLYSRTDRLPLNGLKRA